MTVFFLWQSRARFNGWTRKRKRTGPIWVDENTFLLATKRLPPMIFRWEKRFVLADGRNRESAARPEIGRRISSAFVIATVAAQKVEKENLPTVSTVCGLQGGRILRLDPSAAGLRRVLLSRRVHVPVGQPHERFQPRSHADAYELGESDRGDQIVLRADQAVVADVALRGRRGQTGGEKLPRHGRGGMRLQVRGDDEHACPSVRLSVRK